MGTFIKDRRYLYEEIGLFEGAYLYKKGIYRPTNSSIMNSGGNRSNLFNAPTVKQSINVPMN